MERLIKVTTTKIRSMAMVYIPGLMGSSTMVGGLKESNMVMGSSSKAARPSTDLGLKARKRIG